MEEKQPHDNGAHEENGRPDGTERRRCAVCGAPFGPERDRALGGAPFCSERCRLQDLSKWFSGGYAIPAITPPPDIEAPELE